MKKKCHLDQLPYFFNFFATLDNIFDQHTETKLNFKPTASVSIYIPPKSIGQPIVVHYLGA